MNPPRPEDIERLCDVWLGRARKGAVAGTLISEVLPAIRLLLGATGAGVALGDGSGFLACGDLATEGSAELVEGRDGVQRLQHGALVRRSAGEERRRLVAVFRFEETGFDEASAMAGVEAALTSLRRAVERLVPPEERRFGDFEIVARLGEGGMAEVHLARDTDDELVALKRIRGHLAQDATFLELFLAEVRTAQQVRHPNVVRILEYGVEGSRPYLAMEYLSGASLSRFLSRALEGGVDVPQAVRMRLALDFCEGLEAVHARGIVHCDVSPENLFVTFEGVGKVIDFGVARAAGDTRRSDESVRGKLGYLAPEQLSGERVDARSDLFSLGVVAHELFGGAMPETLTGSLKRYAAPGLAPIDGAPAALSEAIRRATSIDPSARFESCSAFGEALSESGIAAASREAVAAAVRNLFGDREAALKRLLGGGPDAPGEKVRTFRLPG